MPPSSSARDSKVNALDAEWVLNHVEWLRNWTDGGLVNLNHGTQSYHRWDWVGCLWGGGGWDDGWCHEQNAVRDALYLGVCR